MYLYFTFFKVLVGYACFSVITECKIWNMRKSQKEIQGGLEHMLSDMRFILFKTFGIYPFIVKGYFIYLPQTAHWLCMFQIYQKMALPLMNWWKLCLGLTEVWERSTFTETGKVETWRATHWSFTISQVMSTKGNSSKRFVHRYVNDRYFGWKCCNSP